MDNNLLLSKHFSGGSGSQPFQNVTNTNKRRTKLRRRQRRYSHNNVDSFVKIASQEQQKRAQSENEEEEEEEEVSISKPLTIIPNYAHNNNNNNNDNGNSNNNSENVDPIPFPSASNHSHYGYNRYQVMNTGEVNDNYSQDQQQFQNPENKNMNSVEMFTNCDQFKLQILNIQRCFMTNSVLKTNDKQQLLDEFQILVRRALVKSSNNQLSRIIAWLFKLHFTQFIAITCEILVDMCKENALVMVEIGQICLSPNTGVFTLAQDTAKFKRFHIGPLECLKAIVSHVNIPFIVNNLTVLAQIHNQNGWKCLVLKLLRYYFYYNQAIYSSTFSVSAYQQLLIEFVIELLQNKDSGVHMQCERLYYVLDKRLPRISRQIREQMTARQIPRPKPRQMNNGQPNQNIPSETNHHNHNNPNMSMVSFQRNGVLAQKSTFLPESNSMSNASIHQGRGCAEADVDADADECHITKGNSSSENEPVMEPLAEIAFESPDNSIKNKDEAHDLVTQLSQLKIDNTDVAVMDAANDDQSLPDITTMVDDSNNKLLLEYNELASVLMQHNLQCADEKEQFDISADLGNKRAAKNDCSESLEMDPAFSVQSLNIVGKQISIENFEKLDEFYKTRGSGGDGNNNNNNGLQHQQIVYDANTPNHDMNEAEHSHDVFDNGQMTAHSHEYQNEGMYDDCGGNQHNNNNNRHDGLDLDEDVDLDLDLDSSPFDVRSQLKFIRAQSHRKNSQRRNPSRTKCVLVLISSLLSILAVGCACFWNGSQFVRSYLYSKDFVPSSVIDDTHFIHLQHEWQTIFLNSDEILTVLQSFFNEKVVEVEVEAEVEADDDSGAGAGVARDAKDDPSFRSKSKSDTATETDLKSTPGRINSAAESVVEIGSEFKMGTDVDPGADTVAGADEGQTKTKEEKKDMTENSIFDELKKMETVNLQKTDLQNQNVNRNGNSNNGNGNIMKAGIVNIAKESDAEVKVKKSAVDIESTTNNNYGGEEDTLSPDAHKNQAKSNERTTTNTRNTKRNGNGDKTPNTNSESDTFFVKSSTSVLKMVNRMNSNVERMFDSMEEKSIVFICYGFAFATILTVFYWIRVGF